MELFTEEKELNPKKMTPALLTLMELALGTALPYTPIAAQAQSTPAPQRRLTVNGQAMKKFRPDKAEITIGVVKQAKTAREAVQANAVAAQAVRKSILSVGIAENDIQTSNFSVDPVESDASKGEPHIIGFRSTNEVHITVHDLKLISTLIDQATESGSNTIDNIHFGLEKEREASDTLLDDAIADARRRAERIAKAAGVQITGIYEINTSPVTFAQPQSMRLMRGGFAKAETPISSGELNVTSNVTIVYEITGSLSSAHRTLSRKAIARK